MSLVSRIDDVVIAIANLIKGRQPASTVLTDVAGRTIGATSSTSIIDRAAGDARYGKSAFVFVIDGGGVAITPGLGPDLIAPFTGEIEEAVVLTDVSGSIVIDVWKDTYANAPPVVGDSITASAKPTVSSSTKSSNTTLTGWTKTFSAGDVFRVNVDSATTVKRVTLVLKVKRT